MTIHWSYRVKVSGGEMRKKKTHKGGASTLYKDANGYLRFQLWQEDSQPRPLFLGVLMAWVGSQEKDVYFCAVPSQKSTVSRAGDNHRAAVVARWLCLSWPHPIAVLPAAKKCRLCCPRFTPSVQKQAEGRNKKGQKWLNMFASGENCANCIVLSTLVAAVAVGGRMIFAKFKCGRMLWANLSSK